MEISELLLSEKKHYENTCSCGIKLMKVTERKYTLLDEQNTTDIGLHCRRPHWETAENTDTIDFWGHHSITKGVEYFLNKYFETKFACNK